MVTISRAELMELLHDQERMLKILLLARSQLDHAMVMAMIIAILSKR